MTEEIQPIPETAIRDKALAEEMAYAEKPHREDVLALNALIHRTYEYDEILDYTRPLDTGRNGGSSTNSTYSPKTTNANARLELEAARHASINLADDAAEQARKEYLATNPETPTPSIGHPAEQAVMPEHSEAPKS